MKPLHTTTYRLIFAVVLLASVGGFLAMPATAQPAADPPAGQDLQAADDPAAPAEQEAAEQQATGQESLQQPEQPADQQSAEQATDPQAAQSDDSATAAPDPTAPEATDEPAVTAPDTAGESEPQTPVDATADAAADPTATGEADDAVEEGSGAWEGLLMLAIVVALFVVPILIGRYLADKLKMPDHAWKISLALGSLAAAAVILSLGQFKAGPDLAGGITLIYELAGSTELVGGDEEFVETEPAPETAEGQPRTVEVDRLIDALKQRIDPSGTREVTIRRYGNAIEIIIPNTDAADLEFVKRRITDLGQLEFRITADPAYTEDRLIVENALELAPRQTIYAESGIPRARWVPFNEDEFPPGDDRLVVREANGREEALVLIDPWDVTGEYLTSATMGVSQTGGPAVHFEFNRFGADRFSNLTSANLPHPVTGQRRHLGIVLDNQLISAPTIEERITNNGQISGRGMDQQEVEFIVSILNAGSLPAALSQVPISEETISPTLGLETILKGRRAIAVSLSLVLLFMLFYYKVAGVVACLTLAANMLLVLAAMVLIQAAFTLPGLAGLVLTVGMSVDANVLIFERIREELKRGAALRMAIRNGFGRATTTIVDANVTTLITSVVLYTIGTDQIKGFAVTLFLGIVMSMYTAIFCARIVFDILEKQRWQQTLSMFQMLGQTNIDFYGKRRIAYAISTLLIVLGLFGIYERGSGILSIDFTGGSSVTMVLEEDQAMSVGQVRDVLEQTPLVEQNLSVVSRGDAVGDNTWTEFTINARDDDVDAVKAIMVASFGDRLKTYALDVESLEPFEEGEYQGMDATLLINTGEGYEQEQGIGHDSLLARIETALQETGHEGVLPSLTSDGYDPGSEARFKEWSLRLGLDEAQAREVVAQVQSTMASEPMFPLANKIGGRVAGDLQTQALYAIGVSILGIVGYLWIRFQKVVYGLAAVVAVMHDVLVTLGAIALSSYVAMWIPPLANLLQIEAFQISLPIVAALLTIIGYSLNDTIVVFDRIREVRGKSPHFSADMINKSINQTLSRTLLTSLTTWIVVVILYFAGGAGVHGFAFALVVGVVVGTYSSIFVAAPFLMWQQGDADRMTAGRTSQVA